ncbi:MAG: type II secretion system F family protein [Candidatus Brocadiaceae bacterium]
MQISLIISIGVFIGTALLMVVIFLFIRASAERRALLKKIQSRGHVQTLGESAGAVLKSSQEKERWKQYLIAIVSYFGIFAKPKREEDLSRTQKSLLNLGFRNHNATLIFLGAKVLCAIIFPAAIFLLKLVVIIPLSPLHLMALYVFFALFGFYLPNIWLRMRITKRKEKILEGFPDALDMLVVCVESGMGLDAAIDRVGEEIKFGNKVLGEEFKIYNRELRVGKTRRDALRNLGRRTELEEINNMVTLLIQTDKFGTSIAQALRAHSDFMRIQRQQRAEEKAAKLAVKLLFPMILFIFPSLFIVILGPALIQVFRVMSK